MDIEHDPVEEETYAKLSFLIETNDHVAGALFGLISAAELLALIEREDWFPRDLEQRVHQELGATASNSSQVNFAAALRRWRKRLPYAPESAALLGTMRRCGGGMLLPGDAAWPRQLDDLGHGRPLCLWWRTRDPRRLARQELRRNVAIVGSRDSSDYGNQATTQLAAGLRQAGFCIVSGGAYGIDACAHRAALQEPEPGDQVPPTIALLAGGLDRLYPAGNANLLQQVIEHGVLLSEVPPGTAPTRFRFLNRNRLISAFCHLIIVTEARFRSGALNTARQAVDLGREVAALPGSVFSPNSVGTHRLLRAGEAGLVTNVEDALELLPGVPAHGVSEPEQELPVRPGDGLNATQSLVLDVLPRRGSKLVDELCALSGVSAMEVLRALTVLQGRGQAATEGFGWRRVGG